MLIFVTSDLENPSFIILQLKARKKISYFFPKKPRPITLPKIPIMLCIGKIDPVFCFSNPPYSQVPQNLAP